MDKAKKIILVDGSSYLYRAFHAMPSLTGPQEQPTGVIYGVVNMIKRLIEDKKPDYFVVVFDPRGKTFRHDLYSEYKAQRPPMPEELSQQVPLLFELIKALGYPMVQIEKVEADDVIGTLARKAQDEKIEVLISTGDKDLMQLVGEDVTLLNTMKDEYLDPDGVMKKIGVSPDQVIDYLALMGDRSDNIPGVAGVGPKTAVKWLTQYKTLDAVIEHAAQIKGKVGENLKQAIAHLPLSRDLATIRCDLDIPADFHSFKLQPADTDKLRQFYTRFGFKKWLEEVGDGGGGSADIAAASGVTGDYQLVLSKKDLEQWLEKLNNADGFAFDTETTSLNYMQARVVGISFAVQPGEAAYVPFGHDYEGAPTQLSEEEVLVALKPLLEDSAVSKIGHNLKYDRNVLANHGIRLCGIRHDSMLESYVYNSVASRHDLDSLAGKYLGLVTVHYEEIAGRGVKQKTFNQIELESACRYAAEDADVSLRLHEYFYPRLEQARAQKNLYEEVEISLVPVLSDIERYGVLLDTSILNTQSGVLKKRITEIEKQAYKVAGHEFNLDSPVQIREILFKEQSLPSRKKTPKGQPSTSEEVLHELAQDFELPRLILDYRALSKLKSTYTDKLPRMVDPDSGRVHTSYHQAVTATGRLSSSDPNLQNIPVRTTEGRQIRRAFKVPPGYRLLAADYSQIELRIMAHLSEDKRLCKAFQTGKDVHAATASEIFSVPAEEVTDEQRRSAKAVNFGLIYGMSAFGLAKQLGLDFTSAKQYMSVYFKRYPGVQAYMEEVKAKAKELGYVETLFGRRLYLPEIHSRAVHRRRYAERTAVNAPMQGSAADIMKRAMVDLHGRLQESGCDARIIMQVHDELLIEVADKDVEKTVVECHACMSAAAQLKVPLLVVIGEGCNWDEAH